jgi:hypothetical protein
MNKYAVVVIKIVFSLLNTKYLLWIQLGIEK